MCGHDITCGQTVKQYVNTMLKKNAADRSSEMPRKYFENSKYVTTLQDAARRKA